MIRFFAIALLGMLIATTAHAAPAESELTEALSAGVSEHFKLPSSASIQLLDVHVGNRPRYESADGIESVVLAGRARMNGILAAKVVLREGNKNNIIWVRFRLLVTAYVVTAKHALSRNQRIGAADITLAKQVLKHGQVSFEPADILGRFVRASTQPGAILNLRNTKNVATARRGDRVGVLIRRGGVAIQTSGELVTSGDVGDRIRVKITPTGKTVPALVRSEELVEVIQ